MNSHIEQENLNVVELSDADLEAVNGGCEGFGYGRGLLGGGLGLNLGLGLGLFGEEDSDDFYRGGFYRGGCGIYGGGFGPCY